ncbi:hypothetical protein ARMSODRAFT_320511 [Armillaria solidipes]|uniref:Uncharacterized protein n=1 Tax=Armillaria solidipes TaxID=1076256 RepID=A0A2H3BRF5_9AGAR|nr:hypothetical protein ARMSODRAFT_320511 [Armillaria solidipes]
MFLDHPVRIRGIEPRATAKYLRGGNVSRYTISDLSWSRRPFSTANSTHQPMKRAHTDGRRKPRRRMATNGLVSRTVFRPMLAKTMRERYLISQRERATMTRLCRTLYWCQRMRVEMKSWLAETRGSLERKILQFSTVGYRYVDEDEREEAEEKAPSLVPVVCGSKFARLVVHTRSPPSDCARQ